MAHRFKRAITATVAAVAMAGSAACAADSSFVHLEQGAVRGTTTNGVDAFLGIPYGASTAGHARWRAPRPAASWPGIHLATTFGPACQQDVGGSFGPYTPEYLVQGPVSEDCLSLNVWRPSAAASRGAALPVMVWIHGGGFTGGSGAIPIYNGAAVASGGVIVVTVNYRLGVFGFLAHPDLSRDDGAPGNYGIQDLLLALHWVKDNVKALGGDPSRVTLAGQSAGSMSIHDLMVVPDARGLFQQVISESGPGMGYPPEPVAKAESTGKKLFTAAGVTTIEQLRGLPAADVAKAANAVGTGLLAFAPVMDGRLIPSDPYASAPGTFIDTPVLAGMNADEAFSLPKTDKAGLEQDITAMFGVGNHEAMRLYGVKNDVNAESADRLMRRERGMASTYRWASARTAAGTRPVFLYLFDHVEPGSGVWGSFHTSEVPYALGNLDAAKGRLFTPLDRAISRDMTAAWVNFIKTGNPNAEGHATWPRYDAADPRIMHIGVPMQAEPLLDAEKRKFFDAYVESGGKLSLF